MTRGNDKLEKEYVAAAQAYRARISELENALRDIVHECGNTTNSEFVRLEIIAHTANARLVEI